MGLCCSVRTRPRSQADGILWWVGRQQSVTLVACFPGHGRISPLALIGNHSSQQRHTQLDDLLAIFRPEQRSSCLVADASHVMPPESLAMTMLIKKLFDAVPKPEFDHVRIVTCPSLPDAVLTVGEALVEHVIFSRRL